MNINNISSNFVSINTLKMLKKDSPIFLQNINMIAHQLFLLFKKSTTFWDNPRTCEKTKRMISYAVQLIGFSFSFDKI